MLNDSRIRSSYGFSVLGGFGVLFQTVAQEISVCCVSCKEQHSNRIVVRTKIIEYA